MQANWVRFGWQGISGRIPENWSPRALGGDYGQGYCRLEDAEYPRLELKWSQKKVDIEKSLEGYLRSLAKPRRETAGRPEAPEITRGVKIISRRAQPDKTALGFSWRAPGVSGAGLIWSCTSCGRTVIGQARGYGKEDAVALAKEIFSGLEDHAVGGKQIWALYGLECEVPENFRLVGQSLLSGYLELAFQQAAERLRIRRWGLAGTVLAEQGLGQWFARTVGNNRKEPRWQAAPAEVKGHAGLELQGVNRSLLMRLLDQGERIIERLIRREPPRPDYALGRVWHCPGSNRIYLLEHLRPKSELLLAELAESVPCH